MSTADICRMVFTRPEILSAVAPAKVSAQSPPCSRKARPSATSPSAWRMASTSPAKTSGGTEFSSAMVLAKSSCSLQVGCWSMCSSRQLSRPWSSVCAVLRFWVLIIHSVGMVLCVVSRPRADGEEMGILYSYGVYERPGPGLHLRIQITPSRPVWPCRPPMPSSVSRSAVGTRHRRRSGARRP